ncbi:hypothetical protein [Minwuia sp.]|uniref:hypothetical protein n=1 Tax=Minwuia sp. TaxID=2493630 RepID=UPI003A95CE32
MPLIRTLLFEAVRRVAADPDLRRKADHIARERVMPLARQTARQAGEVVRSQQSVLKDEVAQAQADAAPGTTRAEIAGRVTRRMMERAKDRLR